MNATFSRKLVMALTGVTRSQLEHWDALGIVRPAIRGGRGKGSRKEYSFRDIVQLRIAKQLRDEGISLQKIRKALAYLRKHFSTLEAPLAELKFLTDGVSLFVLTDDPQVILNALEGQVVSSFALGKVIEDLRRDVQQLAQPIEEQVTVEGQVFTVVLTPDLEEGGYTVTCKEIPAAISQGETEQEALDNIIDAITLCLEAERDLATQQKVHGQ
ncbi:MAG: MerR family transcriptional regulator [Nitrospinota bacterium]|nr:MAG: MerR family transcriptional regulator [Nitrospinota bacterium]